MHLGSPATVSGTNSRSSSGTEWIQERNPFPFDTTPGRIGNPNARISSITPQVDAISIRVDAHRARLLDEPDLDADRAQGGRGLVGEVPIAREVGEHGQHTVARVLAAQP